MKCSRAQRKKTKATAKATAAAKNKRRQVVTQKYRQKKAKAKEKYVLKRMAIAEKSGRKYVPRAHGPGSVTKRQMAAVTKKLDQGVLAGIVFFQMVWPGFSICLHPDGCKAWGLNWPWNLKRIRMQQNQWPEQSNWKCPFRPGPPIEWTIHLRWQKNWKRMPKLQTSASTIWRHGLLVIKHPQSGSAREWMRSINGVAIWTAHAMNEWVSSLARLSSSVQSILFSRFDLRAVTYLLTSQPSTLYLGCSCRFSGFVRLPSPHLGWSRLYRCQNKRNKQTRPRWLVNSFGNRSVKCLVNKTIPLAGTER